MAEHRWALLGNFIENKEASFVLEGRVLEGVEISSPGAVEDLESQTKRFKIYLPAKPSELEQSIHLQSLHDRPDPVRFVPADGR